ncbi:unnamed protein product [Linum trigynum]|uniref:Uncharacterized protein n=1 Tax=Linum trigynum TaxID=586398 RepID=A0AAV2CDX2_9ROSI
MAVTMGSCYVEERLGEKTYTRRHEIESSSAAGFIMDINYFFLPPAKRLMVPLVYNHDKPNYKSPNDSVIAERAKLEESKKEAMKPANEGGGEKRDEAPHEAR